MVPQLLEIRRRKCELIIYDEEDGSDLLHLSRRTDSESGGESDDDIEGTDEGSDGEETGEDRKETGENGGEMTRRPAFILFSRTKDLI